MLGRDAVCMFSEILKIENKWYMASAEGGYSEQLDIAAEK